MEEESDLVPFSVDGPNVDDICVVFRKLVLHVLDEARLLLFVVIERHDSLKEAVIEEAQRLFIEVHHIMNVKNNN